MSHDVIATRSYRSVRADAHRAQEIEKWPTATTEVTGIVIVTSARAAPAVAIVINSNGRAMKNGTSTIRAARVNRWREINSATKDAVATVAAPAEEVPKVRARATGRTTTKVVRTTTSAMDKATTTRSSAAVAK